MTVVLGLSAVMTLWTVDKWARTRRLAASRDAGQLVLGEPVPARVPEHFTYDHARGDDPDTSAEASRPTRRKNASRSQHQAEILDELRGAGAVGMTDDELKVTLHWRPENGTSKRRLDLVRAGLIVDSGDRRPSRYGSPQIVWVLA